MFAIGDSIELSDKLNKSVVSVTFYFDLVESWTNKYVELDIYIKK